MGTFWATLVALYVAAHPGTTLNVNTYGQPWPFTCVVTVEGGGFYAAGWADMPDRWDPEPIEDTCDRAAEDLLVWACSAFPPESLPEYCEF